MAPADLQSEIQTFKGWGFVAITGAILFVSVLRALRAQEEAAETIGRQQSKFRTYIENAPMAVFVLDSRGRCIEANQQAADLVGCDLPTLFTLSVADFAPPGEDRVVAEVAMATLAAQRWIEGDFRLLRQDGRIIWIHARAAGLGDQQFIGCAYDVTSQKEDEERLRQAGACVQEHPRGRGRDGQQRLHRHRQSRVHGDHRLRGIRGRRTEPAPPEVRRAGSRLVPRHVAGHQRSRVLAG